MITPQSFLFFFVSQLSVYSFSNKLRLPSKTIHKEQHGYCSAKHWHSAGNTVFLSKSNEQPRSGYTRSILHEQPAKYGEAGGSFMIKEFSMYEQLEEIIDLSSRPLPQRPDGILLVVKYTCASRPDCTMTEAQYERLARDNPATLFLRCFEEYEGADLLISRAKIQVFPTYDLFYGGNRVARIEGPYTELIEKKIDMYQYQNSNLDLFSEDADNRRRLAWGDGKIKDPNSVPQTTNRFIPGYDWNKDGNFFDDLGDKAQEEWDKAYGEWLPDVEED